MSLLSVEEAAERLNTSPRFIRRLIAERRIAFLKIGRHVRLDSADVDAFVAAGRVEPRQQLHAALRKGTMRSRDWASWPSYRSGP